MNKNKIIAAAYIAAAEVFEVYASDQIACKRFQTTQRGKADCDLRASIWTDAANELRTSAKQDEPAEKIDWQNVKTEK